MRSIPKKEMAARRRPFLLRQEPDQFGFVHVAAIPYGLTTPGGVTVALLIFEASMGNWKVDEVDVSVPCAVAVAVNVLVTHIA